MSMNTPNAKKGKKMYIVKLEELLGKNEYYTYVYTCRSTGWGSRRDHAHDRVSLTAVPNFEFHFGS